MQVLAPKPATSPSKNADRPAQATPMQTPAPPPSAIVSSGAPSRSSERKQAAGETQIVVENLLYRITFSNHGALVKSWILKGYKNEKGRELDLVNSAAAASVGFPLSLITYDKTIEEKLNQALY